MNSFFFPTQCKKLYQLLVKMAITAKGRSLFPLSWIVVVWIFFQWVGKFIKNRLNSKKERWFIYRITLNCGQELDWLTDHPETTTNSCLFFFSENIFFILPIMYFDLIICQSNSKTQQNQWKLSALLFGLMSFLK